MYPSVDHSLLSPSGRMSKRALKAAQERTRRGLFGDGLPFPSCPQPTEREALLRQAQELRLLASRGVTPKKLTRKAVELEQRAANIN